MGRWLETYQTPEEIMMAKIKTISMNVIAKMKAELPDFEFDFETFVKELSTDDAQITRLFEILIKDSYKRTKRLSRSSSQAPSSASPSNNEARFARLIQQHSRLLVADGNGMTPVIRSRSPMEREFQGEGLSNIPPRVMAAFAAAPAREEEKEEDGTVENRETGLGTVVA